MAQGRELKGRIKSIEGTRKITRSMEMVATSKLKRAQDRVIAARPYAKALEAVIADLYSPELAERFPLLRQPESGAQKDIPTSGRRAAVILLTSNQGLAGAFNANLIREARNLLARLTAGGVQSEIHVVGRKGVGFFHQLQQKGNFVPVQATTATVKNGTTPVVLDWDYLSATHGKDVPTWKIFVPNNAVLGGYYAQAISKQAPHPAAARLWEEYLYSNEGQNLWLKGGARPVRMAAMTTSGGIDAAAAAALPAISGTPVFLSPDQATKAQQYLGANWAKAIS